MGTSPESITKLKTDFEAKIADLAPAAQSTAKTAWNRTIDTITAALVTQIATSKALQFKDKIALSGVTAAAGAAANAVKNFASKVKLPAKTLVKKSNAPESSELTKTMDSISAKQSAAERIAANAQARAEKNAERVENSIKTMELNVKSLEKLKF